MNSIMISWHYMICQHLLNGGKLESLNIPSYVFFLALDISKVEVWHHRGKVLLVCLTVVKYSNCIYWFLQNGVKIKCWLERSVFQMSILIFCFMCCYFLLYFISSKRKEAVVPLGKYMLGIKFANVELCRFHCGVFEN